ncbi:MAG: glucose-1-phosphate cytidylyltransferase [Bacteroidales bacterium]
MKAVILAGGFGTRLGEYTHLIPKPMVEIGGKPIMWHIMKIYSQYGITDFIICGGYKQYVIKEYFSHYFIHNADMTIDMSDNSIEMHSTHSEKWRVTIIDTGLNTMTGGRIKRIQKYVGDEPFLLTYGDVVADIDIAATIDEHKRSGAFLSVTAYRPICRFGVLDINAKDNMVNSFVEKPAGDGSWINAGFFVCEPQVFDYISGGDTSVFEKETMEGIARAGKMHAYLHNGFWSPMDTMRDNTVLNEMWDSGNAPWKIWTDDNK